MWFYDVLCGFVGFNMMFRWFNMMFIWFYIVFNIFVLYWLGFQITIAIPNDSPDMWWRKPSISCRGLWRFGTTFLFGFSQISFVKFEIPNVGLAWWLYFCHEFCWGARCCSVLQFWIRITLTVFGFCIVWRIPILQLGGVSRFLISNNQRGLLFKHGNWWSSWIISFLWYFDRPRHVETPSRFWKSTSQESSWRSFGHVLPRSKRLGVWMQRIPAERERETSGSSADWTVCYWKSHFLIFKG